MKRFTTYIVVFIILFYLLPFLISVTPIVSGIQHIAALIITMLSLTLTSLSFGRKHGFSLLLPIIAIVIFLPYAFLSYKTPRIIFYSFIYFFSIIIGNSLGLLFRKKK